MKKFFLKIWHLWKKLGLFITHVLAIVALTVVFYFILCPHLFVPARGRRLTLSAYPAIANMLMRHPAGKHVQSLTAPNNDSARRTRQNNQLEGGHSRE